MLVGRHHSEYFDALRNRGLSFAMRKVFFVRWGFFPLPLLPDEGQHGTD